MHPSDIGTSKALTVSVLLLTMGAACAAELQQPASSSAQYDGYERASLYVPVRDGTRLAVDIFRPTRAGGVAEERLPVVWMHTPYNRRVNTSSGAPTVESYPGYALQLVKYGYVVAVADFRGLYASFGQNRGYNRGEWVSAARMDAYDLTEWFAKQPWSSGRIGMWGCSATGGSQLQAASTRPPSLKAIMPMSAEFDAYDFVVMGGVQFPEPWPETTSMKANAERDAKAVPVDGPEGPRLLAEAIAGHRDNVESPGRLPFRDSRSESLDLEWWKVSSPSSYLDALKAGDFGVYLAANWDEAGTKPGAFLTFANLPRDRTKLVVGPKGHCRWDQVKDDTDFAIVAEELRFFDHWLKGVDNHVMDERVTYYTYNAPHGSEWRRAPSWPLPNEHRTRWYVADGTLSDASPAAAGEDAVTISRPGKSTVIKIERQEGGRPYLTEPLREDLEVTGVPAAHIWIKTQGADVLAMAWLDDLAPDGTAQSYQMLGRLLASDRALAVSPYDNLGLPWHSFLKKDARPLQAGKPTELAFEMLPMSYIFKAGHRLRLTITFTDPQGRSEGIAPVEVLRGGRTASYIELPVIASSAAGPQRQARPRGTASAAPE